jgi:carbon monoxide dehydrogenase subunit G
MAVKISIEVSRTFAVTANFDRVFNLLSDVPESASYFPRVDTLIDLGDNCYRWEMRKIGIDRHSIQTIYACRYVSSRVNGTVVWAAIASEGNGLVNGSWNLTESAEGVVCKFHTTGNLRLPLPRLIKLAISPIVKHEFNALVNTYVNNLQKALN